MEAKVRRISGWDDAIISMYLSKRTLTPELEKKIRDEVDQYTDVYGGIIKESILDYSDYYDDFLDRLNKLFKWCPKHITMGRFLDFSFMVYGLHRAGQDDIDAHAKRMDNRIIRNSTRLAKYKQEMSDWYKGKIITTDEALKMEGIELPNKIVDKETNNAYVKTVNGYVKEEFVDNKDVLRGLYTLSIPSDFIFKCNLTEFSHIYKERRNEGGANPEVKQCIESLVDQIEEMTLGLINRDLLMRIEN